MKVFGKANTKKFYKEKARVKTTLAFLTVFSLILALAPTRMVGANSATVDSYEVRYAYTINTYASAEKMQRFTEYYEDESGEYFYPEYFAGFQELEDGKLALLVTDDSEIVQNTVKSILGEDDVSFIKVEYSFNELYRAEEELWKSATAKEDGVIRTSINLQENVVEVCLSEAALANQAVPYSENSLFHVQSEEDWKKWLASEPKRIQPLTEEELYPEGEGMEQRAASADVYAGARTAVVNPKLDPVSGSVGFCAKTNTGTSLVFTHGHGIEQGAFVYLYTNTGEKDYLGRVIKRVWDGVAPKDFSVIEVDSFYDGAISNKVGPLGARLDRMIETNYALKSYNGSTIYAYGVVSGTISGTLKINTEDVDQGRINTIITLKGKVSQGGDSGGPIYFKRQNGLTLLGIIKNYFGSDETQGNTIEMIKSEYAGWELY